MRHGFALLSSLVVVALLAWSCSGSGDFPGKEVMGTFFFTARPLSGNCSFKEMPDGGFGFVATFSHNPGEGDAFYTFNNTSVDAGLNGQVVAAQQTALRRFEECECGDRVQVVESIQVALLSKSQMDALGGN